MFKTEVNNINDGLKKLGKGNSDLLMANIGHSHTFDNITIIKNYSFESSLPNCLSFKYCIILSTTIVLIGS